MTWSPSAANPAAHTVYEAVDEVMYKRCRPPYTNGSQAVV